MNHTNFKQTLNKVPQITAFFWIIKVLCTTVGETAADFLNTKLSFGLTNTSLVMSAILGLVIFFQFKQHKYTAWLYWSVVVLLSVVGTLITDNLTDNFGIPLPISTILFSVALGLTLFSWYKSEKTLSIHSISTRKREIFYWLTILFTFALGTASGDLLAEYLGIGYLFTGLLIAGLIAAIAFAKRFGLNSILGFWTIYILTRPLGASIGDFLSQPVVNSGLGLGTTTTSVIFLTAILGCVIYLTTSKQDQIETTKNVEAVEKYSKPSIILAQTVGMVTIFVILGLVAFSVHQSQTPTQSLGTTSTSASSSLGNLTEFKTITKDTLALVKAGKTTESVTRITDIEALWDKNEPKLKPMNLKDWTKLDGLIDASLKKVRATPQDSQSTQLALNSLLAGLNSVDPIN